MVPSKLCARGGSIVGAYVGASPRPADTNIALGLLKLKAYGLIKLCWWFKNLASTPSSEFYQDAATWGLA